MFTRAEVGMSALLTAPCDKLQRSPFRYCVIFAWARVWLLWCGVLTLTETAAWRPEAISWSLLVCVDGIVAAATGASVPPEAMSGSATATGASFLPEAMS